MITIWGEGRGFRLIWLLEEMGLPYVLRPVDLLQDVTQDAEFMAVNPAGFIPALTDGAVTMVESVAIMEYLLARHGPAGLAPAPDDPAFPLYLQFLHMGEAGLAGPIYWVLNANRLPDPAERNNPTARHARWTWDKRLALVTAQLQRSRFVAGDAFSAADISVAYAVELAWAGAGIPPGPVEGAWLARMRARPAYQRAMAACPARRAWFASLPAT
jgi:glutathione S-transferase